MGLSYLTKKTWHPSNMNNVRTVWEAEHKLEMAQKQMKEHQKILREERQIEELKRIQIDQGIIHESKLHQIEWMYQDRAAFNDEEKTAEQYLLGEAVTEGHLHGKPKGGADSKCARLAEGIHKTDQHLVENFTTNENEAFLRMKDDPLVQIKQAELAQRQQVYDNPMALKQIQKEI